MRIGHDDPDRDIRIAAFRALEKLIAHHGPVLSWHQTLRQGFEFRGQTVLFTSRAAGIFKPAVMSAALSFTRAPPPRSGRRQAYVDDGGVGVSEIRSDEPFPYDFQRSRHHDNAYMVEAFRRDAPLIFFYGIEEGWYRPLWPAFIDEVEVEQRRFQIVVQLGKELAPSRPSVPQAADARALSIERRYATVETKKRLHQDVFRHRVLHAYSERCAVCRLPRRELLEAAHIVADRDERGRPEVPNGLALCRLHHGAFDTDLLGISPDGVIAIAPSLHAATDGPTLEIALKGFDGARLHLPRSKEDRPRREYLELRFEEFKKAS